MIEVNVTLIDGKVVLKTNDDLSDARKALTLAASLESDHHVWIINEQSADVVWGWSLGAEDIAKLVEPDATDEERDAILDEDYVRYGDSLYPLSDFSPDWSLTHHDGLPAWAQGWHAYLSDSFYSGLLLRYSDNDDSVPDFTGESGVTIATYIVG